MRNFFYLFIMGLFIVTACQNETTPKLHGEYAGTFENGFPITIGFDDEKKQFYGNVVNNFFGTFETNADNLSFKNVGATRMMGPPNGMAAEDSFLPFLNNVQTFSRKDNVLTLIDKDGKEMVFKELKK